MKVTYMAYRRLCIANPEAVLNDKIVPGDDVEVSDKWAKFFEGGEVLKVESKEEDPELLERGRLRVEARKERQAAQQEEIRRRLNDDDDDKKDDKSKKDEFVLPLDDMTKSLVDYKQDLKAKGFKRVEINRLVAERKAEMLAERGGQEAEQEEEEDKPAQRGRGRQAAKPEAKAEGEEGELVKDPVTGEFKQV